MKKYLKLILKFIIWLFRTICQEILELISWISLRVGKIKKSFKKEFFPLEINQSETLNVSTSDLQHEEILSDFKTWLEEFSDEQINELKLEIQSETASPNLLDFYSQLTALKQNYLRQTKTGVDLSKTFQEEFGILREELKNQNHAFKKAEANFKTQIVEARQTSRKEILSELLFVHEGLMRCVAAAAKEKIPKSFWTRKSVA
ncbi:MAG: hypothetical protein ACTSXL_05820, partial [Alphaproteobacteria bacterium]